MITDDYPGEAPHRFTGGTIKQVAIDVSGEAYVDLEREADLMLMRSSELSSGAGRVTLAPVGTVLVGVAILGAVCGVASVVPYEGDAISSDTLAELGVASLYTALAVTLIGFLLRKRVSRARDAMFVALATLGAWFLVLVYALGRDTA